MLVGTYQIAAISHAGIIVDEWFVNYKTQNRRRPKGHAYWYYHQICVYIEVEVSTFSVK